MTSSWCQEALTTWVAVINGRARGGGRDGARHQGRMRVPSNWPLEHQSAADGPYAAAGEQAAPTEAAPGPED